MVSEYNEAVMDIRNKLKHGEITIDESVALDNEAYEKYVVEAYQGKTALLKEAEQIMEQLAKLIKKNPTMDTTNHELNKKLCKVLNKQFGFKKTIIVWDRKAEYAVNAFTPFGVDVIIKGATLIENKRDKGYYDKTHTHVCYVQASQTMIKNFDFTGEEMLAILLHEIGHNFDNSPYMIISTIAALLKTITQVVQKVPDHEGKEHKILNIPLLTQYFMLTNPGKRTIGTLHSMWEKFLDKVPALKVLGQGFNWLSTQINKGIELITAPIGILAAPVALIFSPISQTATVMTRMGEQFADSFAAMYGYAMPLNSGLNKLSDRMGMVKTASLKNPLTKLMTDMALTNRYIVQMCGGDHGAADARLVSNIQYLEREIKQGDFPNEVKKEMMFQVKEMKKFYETYKKLQIEGNEMPITSFTRELIGNTFNGRTDYIAKFFGDTFGPNYTK